MSSSCLPRTPPEALISSMPITMASWMTDSLTASPPDNELMEPTFTVEPDVSAQLCPPSAAGSPARLPQPAASSVTAATIATVHRHHPCEGLPDDPNMWRRLSSGLIGRGTRAPRRASSRIDDRVGTAGSWWLWDESPICSGSDGLRGRPGEETSGKPRLPMMVETATRDGGSPDGGH